jgi:hypothetical protein
MTSFSDKGTGLNTKPHILTAYIDKWHGVSWKIQCPYEGPRECGVLEECYGDNEKYGCSPRPTPPSDLYPPPLSWKKEFPDADLSPEKKAEISEAWDAFFDAQDAWREEHEGREHHRTEQCWFEHTLTEGWCDEEEFLEHFPEGTLISSPMKVLVGYDGHDEDTMPKFKLWEEPTHADS